MVLHASELYERIYDEAVCPRGDGFLQWSCTVSTSGTKVPKVLLPFGTLGTNGTYSANSTTIHFTI